MPKTMTVTFHSGKDAPRRGRRIFTDEPELNRVQVIDFSGCWPTKASSEKIAAMFDNGAYDGRRSWAQLTVHLDSINLVFWLPEELDHVCEVFSIKPFPSARTLIKKDNEETRLNSHWLSRLPKKAKSPKFREKFLKFIETCPNELAEFRRHYAD